MLERLPEEARVNSERKSKAARLLVSLSIVLEVDGERWEPVEQPPDGVYSFGWRRLHYPLSEPPVLICYFHEDRDPIEIAMKRTSA